MPVSGPVRAYYAANIFARSTRSSMPPNFVPMAAPDGRSSIEGCAGGGKNLLEVAVALDGPRVRDVRVACGLCNPAMYVAADLACEVARGRPVADLLALDPLAPASLDPWFAALGGSARPDDAREKFQYALIALQQALRAARGDPAAPVPKVPPPRDLPDDDPG
jgi:hypothetical protein